MSIVSLASFLVLTIATASTARADDALVTFVADLAANKPTAHLTGCELLVTPSGQVRQPCTLSRADLVSDPAATLVVKKTKRAHFPKSQMMWREAEVEARVGRKVVATFRVLEIEGMGAPTDQPGIIAAHWARLTPDKDAAALATTPAAVDKVTPAATISADRNQAVETVQTALGDDNLKSAITSAIKQRAIAFGSAANQRYSGAAGAKSVANWKIDLLPSGKVAVGGTAWVLAGATTVTATPIDRKAGSITYVVFAAFTSSLTNAGSFMTDPALVSFAVAR